MIRNGQQWNIFYETLEQVRHEAREHLREDAEKAIDFYYGVQKPHMDDYFKNVFANWDDVKEKIPLVVLPITKKIINGLSLLYKKDCVRTIVKPDGNIDEMSTKIYSDIIEEAGKKAIMKTVDRFTRLTKTVLVHPYWDIEEGLKYRILTPDMCDVAQNTQNPQRADIVVYRSTKPDTDPALTGGEHETNDYFVYWDKENAYMIDASGNLVETQINEEKKNPYGILPFAVFRDEQLTGNIFWANIDESFVNVNESVNALATDLLHLARTQGFSQPCIRGEVKGKLQSDPFSFLNLTAGSMGGGEYAASQPDFFFRSPSPKLIELQNIIDKWMATAFYLNNLGQNTMTQQSQLASGFAIIASKLDLLEDRENREELFTMAEKQLFEIEKVIYNYHTSERKIPDDARLKIEWPDINFPISEDEIDKRDARLLKYNLTTPAKLLREMQSDISNEADAEKQVRENKALNEELQNQFGTGRFEKVQNEFSETQETEPQEEEE